MHYSKRRMTHIQMNKMDAHTLIPMDIIKYVAQNLFVV